LGELSVDLILAGGRVYTLGRAGLRPHSHLAIAGDRVAAVGGHEVMALRGKRTRVVRLDGAAVLPGFNDAHAHVVYYGLTTFGVDLGDARSIPEIQARLRRGATRLAPGEWLQGMGYRPSELAERRAPTRQELDAAVGDRPSFIDERGGHSRVASTAALAAAGVSAATHDPQGGTIGRDAAGQPDGRLLEAAMRVVADVQPPPSLERRQLGILRAQRLLLSRGVTSVGAAVNRGFADDLRAFRLLAVGGRLRLRVNEFLSWELLEAATRLGLESGFGDNLVRAGPIKVFVDGGASAGAAAIRGGGGTWRTPPAELRSLFAKADAGGLQVACHAVGDAAIEAVLDAVAALRQPARLRHRIEHCTACPPDLIARAARLGVVAVMQPLFAAFKARAGDVFPAHLLPYLGAHRDLAEAGVPLAFSSDLPVTSDPNPWAGLAAVVTDGVQRLTRLAALRAYTLGGSYASYEERLKGTLEPGRLADAQVYDRDPLALDLSAWPALKPRTVLLGGRPVFGNL
jgi:predicted amidohydrolase YtcJ